MKVDYLPPRFNEEGFHCPHCGVYSRQDWYEVSLEEKLALEDITPDENISLCRCENCSKHSIWIDEKMIYPLSSSAPIPQGDMPDEVRNDFMEARNIVDASPRSATALLRVALQKLIWYLDEGGEAVDDNIENLKRKGLDDKIQKALNSVRVIGDEAVPPGQIDPKDDTETAMILFNLVNLVVDSLITQPRKVDEILEKLPNSKKEEDV